MVMLVTYPISFRKKVLNIKEKESLSFAEISKRYNLSKTTVFKWSKKLEPAK
jgi:transposase